MSIWGLITPAPGILQRPTTTAQNTITAVSGIVALTMALAAPGQSGWQIITDYDDKLQSECTASGCLIYGTLNSSGATQFNDVSYTWPSADGSASQRLTTDGAGRLSWATVTGGGG